MIMKKLLLLTLTAISLLTVACKHETKSVTPVESAVHDGAHEYSCPMHPDVKSDQPGKCPKCGMELQHTDGATANTTAYEMRFAVNPATPEAGKAAKLSFTPKIKGNETALVPLDEVHTKKMHIIVASKDLGWYDHIHPEYQADGSYLVTEQFPAGGEYIIFADYTPTGGGNHVERLTVNVSGTPKKPESFTTQNLSTKTDGYTVTLKPAGDRFLTNNMNHIAVDVMQNGKPVTAFEDIMGVKGHLVILSGDGQKYLHVHPEEQDGKLDMHTSFDHAGLYRAFFQFQTNGKVHTSYFTLEVKEGKAGELSGDHGDGQEHHEASGHKH